jgi:hypothetical protein
MSYRLTPKDLPRDGGRALPPTLRHFFETAYHADLAPVRVHESVAVLRAGAHAVTLGDNLYFAPGCYRPGTEEGLWLIGHELAHVLQQREGRVTASHGDAFIDDAALEAEADALATAALRHPGYALRRPIAPPTNMGPHPAVIQPFWERLADGQTVWRDNALWRNNWYEYVTWTWPLFCLPRGVYRRRTTSPFGNHYLDLDYDGRIRPAANAAIGGGLGLDNPAGWPLNRDGQVQELFNRFRRNTWFCYTMNAGAFVCDPANQIGTRWGGDCTVLSQFFACIAEHEFGVQVDIDAQPLAYLANAGQTIDPLAVGNCANLAGVASSYWFFANHFWVTYHTEAGGLQSYDLLFGTVGAPVINANWLEAAYNMAANTSTLANGTIVGPGPQFNVVGVPRGRLTASYQILHVGG